MPVLSIARRAEQQACGLATYGQVILIGIKKQIPAHVASALARSRPHWQPGGGTDLASTAVAVTAPALLQPAVVGPVPVRL